MITAEIDKDALEAQARKLARLSVDSPDTRTRIRKEIRQELQKARGRMSKDTHGQLTNDQRQTFRAVKYAVWRRLLGGNLNILNSRRAGARYWVNRERKVDMNPGMRGGNRRPMGAKTYKVMTYWGKDRGFILRLVSGGGKNERKIAFVSDEHRSKVNRGKQGGDVSKYGQTTNTGRRGIISPRNLFLGSAQTELDKAAEAIGGMIEEELAAVFGA